MLFDGEKVKLNEAGNFYFQKELKVGKNTFVIEHKGKKIYYSIERQVDVLKQERAAVLIVFSQSFLAFSYLSDLALSHIVIPPVSHCYCD